MSITLRAGLILVTVFIMANTASGQWTADSLVTEANLNCISFCEDGSGWIVGNNGTILYKHENSWVISDTVTDADLYSVFMNSESEGWAVGSGGTILHYDGSRWTTVDSPTREGLLSVSFKDPENGIAVGVHGTIIIFSQDRWHLENRIGRDNLYCAEYKHDLLLIGGGTEAGKVPIIKIREKSGNKNTETFDPGYVFLKDIIYLNPHNIWAVGMPGIIYHHNGSKWNRIKMAFGIPSLNSIWFSDEKHGVAVGYQGAVMIYSDGEWKREETPVRIKLNGVGFIGDTYYAVGNRGTILTLKKQSKAIPGKDITSSIQILVKNYPNPVGEFLNYVIPNEFTGRSVRVIISNSRGQTLYTRDLQGLVAGQTFQFGTANLSNGIYFIKIESSDLSGTGKFIVHH